MGLQGLTTLVAISYFNRYVVRSPLAHAIKVASELYAKITWVHVSRLPVAAPGQ